MCPPSQDAEACVCEVDMVVLILISHLLRAKPLTEQNWF